MIMGLFDLVDKASLPSFILDSRILLFADKFFLFKFVVLLLVNCTVFHSASFC